MKIQKSSGRGAEHFLSTYRKSNLKLFAFTLDLESDYAGNMEEYGVINDLAAIDQLLSTLHSLNVKITVFVVGKLIELHPEVINVFEKYNCEFEAHSYSHDFNNPDSEIEIIKSREAYYKYFGKYPRGYRAPRGLISDSGINYLEKQGFLYDSSIFPSYFPDPFKYIFSNKEAHYYNNSKIMEIPLTVVSPLRLTLSISYIKLFGIDLFKKLAPPNFICFDSHLTDFIVNEKSFDKLPAIWKLIYSRNKYKGIELCVNYIEHIKQNGYRFCYMSEIYDFHKNKSG